MPCYDAYAEEEEALQKQKAAQDKQQAEKLGAVLCGIAKAVGVGWILGLVNWEEAGVTQEYFLNWWKEHQEQDAKRG